MDLYPYMLTYGAPQLFVTAILFFGTPLLWGTYLKRHPLKRRLLGVLALWAGGIVVAYGDIFIIAIHARQLCHSEAGLKVYRTAEATGILGYTWLRELEDIGITFVESQLLGIGPKYRKVLKNGRYQTSAIADFSSEVEFQTVETPRTAHIAESSERLVRRNDGLLLAEIVAFSFYPGWLDSMLIRMFGLSWTSARCDDAYPPREGKFIHSADDLIRRTLNVN